MTTTITSIEKDGKFFLAETTLTTLVEQGHLILKTRFTTSGLRVNYYLSEWDNRFGKQAPFASYTEPYFTKTETGDNLLIEVALRVLTIEEFDDNVDDEIADPYNEEISTKGINL
jgi:hypothetical protein